MFAKQFNHPKNIEHLLSSYQNLAKLHLKKSIKFAQICVEENKITNSKTEDVFLKILGNENIEWNYNINLNSNIIKKKLPYIITPPPSLKKLRNILKQEPRLEHEYKIIQVENSEQILLLVDLRDFDHKLSSLVFINRLIAQSCNNSIKELKNTYCKNKNWNILNSTTKAINLQKLEKNKKYWDQNNRNVFLKKLFHSFESSKIRKAPKLGDFKQLNQIKLKLKYENFKRKKQKFDFCLGTTDNDILLSVKQRNQWAPENSHSNYYLQKEIYKRTNFILSNSHLFSPKTYQRHNAQFSFIEKGILYHLSKNLHPHITISTYLKLMEAFAQSASIIKKPYLNFQKRLNNLLKIKKEREKKLCSVTLSINKKHKIIFWETGISKQNSTIKIGDILNLNNKLSLKITNLVIVSNTFLRAFFIQIQAKYSKNIKLRKLDYYYFDKIEAGTVKFRINCAPEDTNFIKHTLTTQRTINFKRILNRKISNSSYRCKNSIEYYLQLNENLNSIFFFLNHIINLNQFKYLPPTYPVKICTLHEISYKNEISMGMGAQTLNDEDKASILKLEYCLNNSNVFFLALKLFSII
nr:hypothetical protein [Cyanidiaceae sp.]